MSAFCGFELIYKGTEEDFKSLWKVLHQIEREGLWCLQALENSNHFALYPKISL